MQSKWAQGDLLYPPYGQGFKQTMGWLKRMVSASDTPPLGAGFFIGFAIHFDEGMPLMFSLTAGYTKIGLPCAALPQRLSERQV